MRITLREREREKKTERQTSRRTDRKTDRQRVRENESAYSHQVRTLTRKQALVRSNAHKHRLLGLFDTFVELFWTSKRLFLRFAISLAMFYFFLCVKSIGFATYINIYFRFEKKYAAVLEKHP